MGSFFSSATLGCERILASKPLVIRAVTPRVCLGRDDHDRPLVRNRGAHPLTAVARKAVELSRPKDFDLRDHVPPTAGRVEIKGVRRRLELPEVLPLGENGSPARALKGCASADDSALDAIAAARTEARRARPTPSRRCVGRTNRSLICQKWASRNDAGTSIVIAKPTNLALSSATNTRRRRVLRFSSSQDADRKASEASP